MRFDDFRDDELDTLLAALEHAYYIPIPLSLEIEGVKAKRNVNPTKASDDGV